MSGVAEDIAFHLMLKGYRVYFSGAFFIKVLPPKAGLLTKSQMHRECLSRVQETSIQKKLKWGRGVLQRQAKLFENTFACNHAKPGFEVVGPNVIDIAVDRIAKSSIMVDSAGPTPPFTNIAIHGLCSYAPAGR